MKKAYWWTRDKTRVEKGRVLSPCNRDDVGSEKCPPPLYSFLRLWSCLWKKSYWEGETDQKNNPMALEKMETSFQNSLLWCHVHLQQSGRGWTALWVSEEGLFCQPHNNEITMGNESLFRKRTEDDWKTVCSCEETYSKFTQKDSFIWLQN